jgi:hypothetical protein
MGDVNAKKPPLAAWKLVTRPKSKGGLSVIRLRLQNDVLLMKNLHKFFNRMDLPWVKLLWFKYYSSRNSFGVYRAAQTLLQKSVELEL